jgi:hypothetical protein
MNARLVAAGMWAGACVCVLNACSDSTGPGFPPIQGNYATNFAFTFNNAANSQQNGTFQITGTMSISRPAGDGSFVGSYVYGGGVNGSGSIAGVIDRQGNVQMDEFGDPGAPPMVEVQFLQTQWPNCDFSRVTSGGMVGALAANTLSLTGTLGFNCDYTNGSQTATFPTTLTEQVDGAK